MSCIFFVFFFFVFEQWQSTLTLCLSVCLCLSLSLSVCLSVCLSLSDTQVRELLGKPEERDIITIRKKYYVCWRHAYEEPEACFHSRQLWLGIIMSWSCFLFCMLLFLTGYFFLGRSVEKTKQGSVLGPILLDLYTYSMSEIVSYHSLSHHSFSDNNQLYKSGNITQLPEIIHSTQSCISDVKAWMTNNQQW